MKKSYETATVILSPLSAADVITLSILTEGGELGFSEENGNLYDLRGCWS